MVAAGTWKGRGGKYGVGGSESEDGREGESEMGMLDLMSDEGARDNLALNNIIMIIEQQIV
jgi:hypothetical protein